ncbi:hypothetical protein PNF29_20705 [Bacillus subtilis]|uniref:hypothetical protein n=1 Tax=Bacillus subtilis TaxID=1423 RepID=UPI002349859F|nr:hypothetical protein [Bacillus subtilis]WCL62840.1 hypothetical protein PNF29_20705 [Bacillus subtilis]
MLIKFLRPEHVSAFLDGSLFFMNTGYFIDLEKYDAKNKGIGDQYEGAHFKILDNKKDVLSIEIDGKYHEIPYNRGFATRNNTSVHQLLLSCFTFIKFNSENFYLDGCKDEEYVYKIKPTVIEGLEKEFEGRIPVLINIELFFKRFESIVEKNHFRRGLVQYFDEYANYPLSKDQLEKDPILALFYKRKYYEQQKEYRIILANPLGLESKTIELGDLRDCIVQFESIQDLERRMIVTTKPTEEHSV